MLVPFDFHSMVAVVVVDASLLICVSSCYFLQLQFDFAFHLFLHVGDERRS